MAYRAWSEQFATALARIMVVYANDWRREQQIWRRYEWA